MVFLLNDNRPSASMECQRFHGIIVSSLGLRPVQLFCFVGQDPLTLPLTTQSICVEIMIKI